MTVRGRVAFATAQAWSDPAPDDRLAARALERAGVSIAPAVWDDPTQVWSGFDARGALLMGLRRAAPGVSGLAERARRASKVPLWNPEPILRWNGHKAYLLDLARFGVPIVPTEIVRRGAREPLEKVVPRLVADEMVVKPAVAASARGFWGAPRAFLRTCSCSRSSPRS